MSVRFTTRDHMVALSLMTSDFGRELPLLATDCKMLHSGDEKWSRALYKVEDDFDAIAALAKCIKVSESALRKLLSHVSRFDTDHIRKHPSVWEEISLRVLHFYIKCKKRSSVANLEKYFLQFAEDAGLSEEEIVRFIRSRMNIAQREHFNARIKARRSA